MDEKIQEIISKNAYMQRMIKRIPEEMVSYYLEKIKDNIVELPGGIIHSKMGQNGEYMNFALPMEGIELLEYYIGCTNSISGQDKTHAVANMAIIHYCTKGRAEIIVGSGRYAYMQPGIMCIEWKQEAQKDFNFYDKAYGGMEIIISLDYISREDGDMLKRLGIDMEEFREAYDKDNDYYIGTCSEKLRYAFEDLGGMIREGTARKENYLVSTINLLNKIQTEEIKVSDRQYYLTKGQRKIAARAGITAGAIYKYFSGKEEMFGEIFAESGKKLMEITRSMMGMDFTAMTDEELVNVLYSRVSVQTFNLLEGDMKLFHMLLKNDSGKCMEQFRDIYVERGAEFAMNYYGELYRRGIACKKLSAKTVYMLTRSEFSMVCEMIADESCRDGITAEMKTAFMEAMDILLHGIEAELGIDKTGGKK